MSRKMWLVAILALATLMLGVAACGGDDDEAAEEPAPPEAVEPAGGEATSIRVAADPDGALAYEQTALTAPAGSITVEFTNEAALGYDFRIEEVGAGTSVFAEGSESLAVERDAGVPVDAPRAGGQTSRDR